MRDEWDVVVVGGGAAGVAAARRLARAGADALLLEARDRLGGRGRTVALEGRPYDLGCGWLHSGDANPWTAIAEAAGRTVDRAEPPWGEAWRGIGFPPADRAAYRAAADAFEARAAAAAAALAPGEDRSLGDLLDPASPWSPFLDAVSGYVSGDPLRRLSLREHGRYADTGVNWRAAEGYGALIADHGAGLPAVLGAPVTVIDHAGPRVRLVTPRGALGARAVIVTLPTDLIAAGRPRFDPPLPGKVDAAGALPLGVADKLFLALEGAEAFEPDTQLYGDPRSADCVGYHLRPFGRPVIEGYFAGDLARRLEPGGPSAFAAHAIDDLARLLGAGVRRRLRPLAASAWALDPFAGGSYSHARPGGADARAALAAPVDGRLFFAGEGCSLTGFTTAHGAHETGVAAAEAALAALGLAAAAG